MTEQISVIIPSLGTEDIFVHFHLFWELDCMLFFHMTVCIFTKKQPRKSSSPHLLFVSVNDNFSEQIMRGKARKASEKQAFSFQPFLVIYARRYCLGKQHLPQLKWNPCRKGQHSQWLLNGSTRALKNITESSI